MHWNQKQCVACERLMSADDAHRKCQRCRFEARPKLAQIIARHRRRWYYAEWRQKSNA